MTPLVRSFVLALVLVALLPAAAQAGATQTSIMMDDDLLVYRDDSTAARTLTQMKSLGVETVRVTVLWSIVAEFARPTKAEIAPLKGKLKLAAKKQAQRFKAADPRTYPTRNWDRYDNLVKKAQELGIRVYFNVTGPGPAWAHTAPPKNLSRLRRTWKPRYGAFKEFVTAVGRRFDGTFKDENGSRGIIPRVDFWSLWNEPNQGGWLTPQWEKQRGSYVPASPAIYRKLHQYGYRGLLKSGHSTNTDIVLMGETAPLGADSPSEKAPMRPGFFLRELACVQSDGSTYEGSAAAARDCNDFAARGPLLSNGYAHHPYTKNQSPLQRDASNDSITMANIADLGALLDGLSGLTSGGIPPGLKLYMTEFGFETSPPDPFQGVPLDVQAKYNQIGEYQAWANERIASQTQFLLVDVAPVRSRPKNTKAYWFTYQSGLFLQNLQPKPAAFAYSMPFIATAVGVEEATGNPVFAFWGQLRFLDNNRQDVAHIQWRPKDGSADWATVGDPVAIDAFGYYTASRVAPAAVPGEWRAAWLQADGAVGSTSLAADGS